MIAGHGVAAALAAATLLLLATSLPAQAQRLSLAERVTRLEQAQQSQKAGDGGTVLVNQVQALQSQVQQLQNQIEELQHQVKQLKQNNKDQYVDLDSRIRKLEGGASPVAASSSAPAPAPAATASAVGSGAVAAGASATPPASASSGNTPAGGTASADQVQQAYNTAFTALRDGHFVDASRQFQDFIRQHPDSSLAPNAFYWLGESYYTVQNFDVALKTFQKLLQLYPDSDKAPGALLKAGYCQDALHKEDAAQKTLKSVVARYPGSSVAQLAQQRLQDIQVRQAN